MALRFSDLRATFINAVFLRRISREMKVVSAELARANQLKEFELSCRWPERFKQHKAAEARGTTPRRPLEMSVGKVEDWDKEWRETHPTHEPDDDLMN